MVPPSPSFGGQVAWLGYGVFATVQNKMHWATHGQTAAEVIHAATYFRRSC